MISAAIWRTSAPVPVLERPAKPERTVTDVPDADRLRGALEALPNDDLAYDEWFKVACSVHYATDGEGLELFREWSAKSPKHDDDFLDARVWPYLQSERGGEVITGDYVLGLAARNGWQDPAIADDFDVVEAPTDEFDALPPVEGSAIRFLPVPAHEFAVATRLRWIIKGVLPHGELAVLYGASGSGKSFMALDLAATIARGVEWRGNRVHQGSVVYIAAEGANGFRNRLRAYAHQHAIDLKDMPLHVIHAAPNMLDKTDALDVAKAITAVVGRPDLIVIDTLAQSMPGGDENAGDDMGKALAHCRGLHRATGALVMLVHHSGKDASKGARGWSGLRAAADVELEVVRADDDRVLTVTKQKDGDDGGEFGFRLETVLVDFDDDGDEVTSCIVAHGDVAPGVKSRKNGKRDDVKANLLRVVAELSGLDGETDISDVETLAAQRGIGRRTVLNKMQALAADGVVAIDGCKVVIQ